MEIMTLIDELTKETLEPVYVFYGEEGYLIDMALTRIKELVLTGPMADFNLVHLRVSDSSSSEIVSQAMQIPMMSSMRLVIVENGDKLTTADWDKLDEYFVKPSSTTCLVIVASKLNVNRGPLARAKKRGQLYKAEPIQQRNVGRYIKSRAENRGVRMNSASTTALANAVGSNLSALDDAIERLGLYAGPGALVTESDVSEVVTAVREHSIFELVDAIGMGRSSDALALIEELIRRREEPIMINAMIARHMRLLLKTRIYLHQGVQRVDFPKLLGVPGFVADKLVDQAGRVRGSHLERALTRLANADFELKSSRRPPDLVIEQAVLDLCL